MKTFSLRKEDVQRDWWIVDARNKILGRLASKIARVLRGKHKPNFTPHVDNGDYVIVINAEKIELSGKKSEQKVYRKHSGYLGNLKETPFQTKLEKDPESIIEHAVAGMLPKNKLGRKMIKKLKVYAGEKHPHKNKEIKHLELGGD